MSCALVLERKLSVTVEQKSILCEKCGKGTLTTYLIIRMGIKMGKSALKEMASVFHIVFFPEREYRRLYVLFERARVV